MLITTSSETTANNTLFIGCVLIIFWVIFKDALRISLYFGVPDGGVILFLVGAFVSFIALMQGLRSYKLSVFDIIVVSYIFYSSIVTLSHSVLYNPYQLTSYQVVVVLAFQFIAMFMLWYFSIKSPHTVVYVTNSVANMALGTCVLLGAILLVFVIVDLNLVFHFYGELLDLEVIVNPFQTSDDGIAVRFSGIFYSALNFGMFVVFCLVISLGLGGDREGGKLLLFVMILFLISSFNRNAMITFAFISTAIFLVRRGFHKAYVLLIMFIGIGSIILFLTFMINMDDVIDPSNSFILSAHSLYSRFEIWAYWLGTLDMPSLLHGYGVIAGMGEKHLYIDNGYVFLIVNSGIVSLLFLIYSIGYLAVKCASTSGKEADIAFFLVLGLPVAMIFNNIVLDPMLMHLFFFYPIALIKKESANGY